MTNGWLSMSESSSSDSKGFFESNGIYFGAFRLSWFPPRALFLTAFVSLEVPLVSILEAIWAGSSLSDTSPDRLFIKRFPRIVDYSSDFSDCFPETAFDPVFFFITKSYYELVLWVSKLLLSEEPIFDFLSFYPGEDAPDIWSSLAWNTFWTCLLLLPLTDVTMLPWLSSTWMRLDEGFIPHF